MLLSAGAGCEAGKVATLDLRALAAPIVLNGSPFIASAPETTAADGGVYEGAVTASASYAGGAYGPYYYVPPWESQGASNDAQLSASKALGGRPNSAIIDLVIDVRTMDLFLIVGYVSQAEITAHGRVVDVAGAGSGMEANPPGQDGAQ